MATLVNLNDCSFHSGMHLAKKQGKTACSFENIFFIIFMQENIKMSPSKKFPIRKQYIYEQKVNTLKS